MGSSIITSQIGDSRVALDSAPPGERSSLGDSLLIALLCLVMHVPWLGLTPLAGTEAHRIFPAREMLRSGNWLVPMLYGQPYATKPPLHHWLIAAAEAVSGHGNVFVWRLPSALDGAVLAFILCWFAGRWFGRTAGIISGLCGVGMIALWGQWQVADIDSTDTLFSALAALCGVDLLVACPRVQWPWIIASGLTIAASLMTKGPGGAPIILGVWLWVAIAAAINRIRPNDDKTPLPSDNTSALARGTVFFLPLMIGALIFVIYLRAAKHSLELQGFGADMRGVQEAEEHLRLPTAANFLHSLFVMPTQLFLFSLPISLAIPLALDQEIRQNWNQRRRQIATALTACVLLGWVICVLSALDNPRYGYVTLPLLCPLAGAVAVAAVRTRRGSNWLRGAIAFTAIAFVTAAGGLAWSARHFPHSAVLLSISVALAVVTAMSIMLHLKAGWRWAWWFVPLMVFAVIPFSLQRADARTQTSGLQTARVLRNLVGAGATVAASSEVTSKPETFYYSGVNVNFFPTPQFTPTNVPAGTWIILDTYELKRWSPQPGLLLRQQKWLCRNGRTDYYLAWYAGIAR